MAAWTRRGLMEPERQTLFDKLLDDIRALEAADEATTRVAIDLAVLMDLGASINDNLRNSDFMQTIQSEFEAAVRHAKALEAALPKECCRTCGRCRWTRPAAWARICKPTAGALEACGTCGCRTMGSWRSWAIADGGTAGGLGDVGDPTCREDVAVKAILLAARSTAFP